MLLSFQSDYNLAGHVLCSECPGYTVGASRSPGSSKSVEIMDMLAGLMESQCRETHPVCSRAQTADPSIKETSSEGWKNTSRSNVIPKGARFVFSGTFGARRGRSGDGGLEPCVHSSSTCTFRAYPWMLTTSCCLDSYVYCSTSSGSASADEALSKKARVFVGLSAGCLPWDPNSRSTK